jgi:nitroreductase
MDVADALAARRSIRAFLGAQPPLDMVAQAIRTAALTPSSGNLQPWRVHVLAGQPLADLKAKMAALTGAPPTTPPQYSVYPPALAEKHRTRLNALVQGIFAREGVAPDQPAEAAAWSRKHFQFFGAPVGLFLFIEPDMGTCQWLDIGAYLQSLMLLLTEQGLATCAEAAWSLWWPDVTHFLGIADDAVLVCGLAVGYPDPDAPINDLVVGRSPLEDFASFRGFP